MQISIFCYLSVMAVIPCVILGLTPQRHRSIKYDTAFLHNLNTRQRQNVPTLSDKKEDLLSKQLLTKNHDTIVQISLLPLPIKSIRKENESEQQSVPKIENLTSLSLDDVFDYHYLHFFDDVYYFNKINISTTNVSLNRTKSKISPNADRLLPRDFRLLPKQRSHINELNLAKFTSQLVATMPNYKKVKENQVVTVVPDKNITLKNTSNDKISSFQGAEEQIESVQVDLKKEAPKTSETVKLSNKEKIEDAASVSRAANGWTAESSVSVEVRIESARQEAPTHNKNSNSSQEGTFSKMNNIRSIPVVHDNMRLKEELILEDTATPKIVKFTVTTDKPFEQSTVDIVHTTEKTTIADMVTEYPLTTESSITTTTGFANQYLFIPSLNSKVRNPIQRHNPEHIQILSKSINITTQLGINPHGLNPTGVAPFGIRPEGISPFGYSPAGSTPLGWSSNGTISKNASISNIKDVVKDQTLSQNQNNTDEVAEERYHVQVKKPDGSINGDYVVLDPSTGSLSGVRYEAIDGADQKLIQQALLSFLSLDPRLDPRPKTSEDTSFPQSESAVETEQILKRTDHIANVTPSVQLPKRSPVNKIRKTATEQLTESKLHEQT